MIQNSISEVTKYIQSLPSDLQDKVFEFVKDLKENEYIDDSNSLKKYAGYISPEDLSLMEETIQTDCRKIDNDEW